MSRGRDLAVALGYRPGTDLAPRVLASGEGLLAERIKAMAEALGIPRYEDAELAELLGHLPLADEIPADLYPAVAEILAFIWSVARARRATGGAVPKP